MLKHLSAAVLAVPLGFLLTGSAISQDGDKKPVKADPMAALAPFVGEWQVEGKWAGGNALKARGVYDWSLEKKIISTKTFVMDKGKEHQLYQGIMAWHPKKKSLYLISFASDGQISEVIMETKEKDTIHIGYTPFHADQPQPVRQTLRFTDKDHFVWTVELKKGEEWTQLIQATWVRKGVKN
jgi:hypothetical protein